MAIPSELAPLALTMGDPGGVGAEISAKAWQALRDQGPVFFLLDDPARYEGLNVPIATISKPEDAGAAFKEALPILPLSRRVNSTFGTSDPQFATDTTESIERAVRLCLDGDASAVVTNPIQKSTLMQQGFEFPGHTEYLEALTNNATMPGGRRQGAIMMLANSALRTVPVTVHRPLAAAITELTTEDIVRAATITAESLIHDFGVTAPRLAIAGLNPHAGEDGELGDEDARVIEPAVAALRSNGINARGPLPADTMFHEEARQEYDAALCMYHDQALIPVKTVAFHETVNVTLGLPIIRTSPDHGTALDIAGKGIARPDSLIAALKLASELSATRQLAAASGA